MSANNLVNAFTVDVEEYFHAAALAEGLPREQWPGIQSSVEANTHKILDLLDDAGYLGTFFVLGLVCERFPGLVREIHSRGHEVASHGYSHKMVYRQSEEEFRAETNRGKKLLEDTTGDRIFGYRAATFSINKDTPWAYDILQDAGFTYDSSIFPISHDRYGDKTAPRFPYLIAADRNPGLIEFPMSTGEIFGMRIPISGGGYFRLLPPALINAGLRKINRRENKPFVFYIHPWEVDVDQPRVDVSRLSRFRHYTNLDKCEQRLRNLLSQFKFDTCLTVLESFGFKADSDELQTEPVGEAASG